MGLMFPAAAIMVLLTVVPVVAVFDRALSHPGSFSRLFDTPAFGRTMLNTLLWTLVSVVGALIVGYAAALLLRSPFLRLTGTWRGLFMIPWIIPGVVGATVWRWSLSSDYGLVNHWLLQAGIIDTPIAWLSNPDIVLYAVALIQIWTTAPFVMIMVSAALTGIPAVQYEAARLDGASAWQTLRYVVLPAISSTTWIAVLTLATWALNSFTIIWVTTSGGPAGASRILPILLYEAFQRGDQSLVSAIAVLQLAICAVFVSVYARAMRSDLKEMS
ncbi:sugar ABC transporter permease [Streptomyces sp. NBC_01476]|uniref:carbohydrate ABC transporter permease n=1 Tax=Streptomyces sp. NBC_01476 TaxID=2903881 RepID=UPI002E329492|nr:sugar ABC transporter permease [Streptomyces sp. NBC_01476]